ncbi:type II CRISPR RNA-guided endonuclease Cas9 [Permianibacter aggregans]|nr:type II CRISPR RNA-guided endonuclease Cas9 [Permianibacter aggregans]
MPYRLALDLGSSSLGWALIRLNAENKPSAIIKAGVRIFPDGRNPKDGSSLAVTRREARAMRRRRDRLLKRKARMITVLTELGFFPSDSLERKALESLNPYRLRAEGLDRELQPDEFARALFHLNQRRGFKSNRKTDKKDNDSGAMKQALSKLRQNLDESSCRTVGEWLFQRQCAGQSLRARYRETRQIHEDGRTRVEKSYDLYIDRTMIEAEFDTLWRSQAARNPSRYTDEARRRLKDVLLFQRPLKPVRPGRCTLLPDEERAPLALPSTQRVRIYQELNNLRVLGDSLQEYALTLQQRDQLAAALDHRPKMSFDQIRRLLRLDGQTKFNLEDIKRQEIRGNATAALLSKSDFFGEQWHSFNSSLQDEIVQHLIADEEEQALIDWLIANTGIDEACAQRLADVSLPQGYGSLGRTALARILPALRQSVLPFSAAVQAAGFEHHSALDHVQKTGEILLELPYYGEYLTRHVGFGTGNPDDVLEKRYGRIANPTVHIGLNQTRVVVNALLKRYGPPQEIIVEVARELKQSREDRLAEQKRQAENQRRNQRLREEVAAILEIEEHAVKTADIQKMILWEELSPDPADRRCPYSGEQISKHRLLSEEVEIEHILPFSETLDDSLNNKTVAMRMANRVKGNRSPWQAFGEHPIAGFDYQEILARAERMPKGKRYRFAPDGYQRWLKDDAGFLARALNDTRYLSRIAREYLRLICPQGTRVIPGQMTALLRAKFGLNDVLGLHGEKNRNDHRHHAVDACVIGVTDQGMLKKFSEAARSAREKQLDRLVEHMPLPWPTYREHVKRAINAIWVSHRPDHNYQGPMHNDTAYGLLGDGRVVHHKWLDGKRERVEKSLKVIEFKNPDVRNRSGQPRHGVTENGSPRPYKGYDGNSNYCIEIVRVENGRWQGEVISTYTAYQTVKAQGEKRLRDPKLSLSGQPLIMRLMIDDAVRLEIDDHIRTMRVAKISANGQIFMCDLHEANVDKRNRDKNELFAYVSKTAGSLHAARGRRVTISPSGELHDPGFAD